MTNETDKRRAQAVLDNLLDRKGVGNELEYVRDGDPETWAEIQSTIGELIRASDEAAGMVLVARVALDRIATAIEVADELTDTMWMPGEAAETVVDFLRALIAGHEGDGGYGT